MVYVYEALSAERQIKGWSRKKKEVMMCGNWAVVSRLAKSKSAHPSTGSGRTDLILQVSTNIFRSEQD